MTKKIQLVFQGGGAKFVQLLAVAEVLQELKKDKRIEITRVAGTSAGAIVAGLIACDTDIENVKTVLKHSGNDLQEKLLPSKRASTWSLLFRYFILHRPLGEPMQLNHVINEIIDCSKNSSTQIPCFITATDINLRTKDLSMRPADTGLHKLKQDIVNSCALPIIFATGKHAERSFMIDGGLVDNFPADDLVEGKEEFGKIVGIGFAASNDPKSKIGDHGRFSYLTGLLMTAIDASVVRSASSTDYHFEIDSPLTTLDFTAGLEYLDSPGYIQLKKLFHEELNRNLIDGFFDDFESDNFTVDTQEDQSNLAQLNRSLGCVDVIQKVLHLSLKTSNKYSESSTLRGLAELPEDEFISYYRKWINQNTIVPDKENGISINELDAALSCLTSMVDTAAFSDHKDNIVMFYQELTNGISTVSENKSVNNTDDLLSVTSKMVECANVASALTLEIGPVIDVCHSFTKRFVEKLSGS